MREFGVVVVRIVGIVVVLFGVAPVVVDLVDQWAFVGGKGTGRIQRRRRIVLQSHDCVIGTDHMGLKRANIEGKSAGRYSMAKED